MQYNMSSKSLTVSLPVDVAQRRMHGRALTAAVSAANNVHTQAMQCSCKQRRICREVLQFGKSLAKSAHALVKAFTILPKY